jgi:hypothetical protein
MFALNRRKAIGNRQKHREREAVGDFLLPFAFFLLPSFTHPQLLGEFRNGDSRDPTAPGHDH